MLVKEQKTHWAACCGRNARGTLVLAAQRLREYVTWMALLLAVVCPRLRNLVVLKKGGLSRRRKSQG